MKSIFRKKKSCTRITSAMSSLCLPWLKQGQTIEQQNLQKSVFLKKKIKIKIWFEVSVQLEKRLLDPCLANCVFWFCCLYSVTSLTSCASLWICRVHGRVFSREMHLHVSLLNTQRGGWMWTLAVISHVSYSFKLLYVCKCIATFKSRELYKNFFLKRKTV